AIVDVGQALRGGAGQGLVEQAGDVRLHFLEQDLKGVMNGAIRGAARSRLGWAEHGDVLRQPRQGARLLFLDEIDGRFRIAEGLRVQVLELGEILGGRGGPEVVEQALRRAQQRPENEGRNQVAEEIDQGRLRFQMVGQRGTERLDQRHAPVQLEVKQQDEEQRTADLEQILKAADLPRRSLQTRGE